MGFFRLIFVCHNVGGFEKRAEKERERERDGKSERQFLVHVSGVSILIPG